MQMQMAGKTGLVFQTPKGTPIEPQNIYTRHFRPAVRRAGLGSLRLHDLRHSFGSWLLDQGEDLIYVSRQMGHASPSITANIYSHVIRKKRPEAAARMSARLFVAE